MAFPYLSLTLVLLISLSESIDAQIAQRGILIFPLEKVGKRVGSPGQMIAFSFSDSTKDLATLWIDGKLFSNEHASGIIPFDSVFAPARVLLYLTSHENPIWSHDIVEEAKCRYLLVKSACELFSFHHAYEELFALYCKYTAEYEHVSSDGKGQPSLAMAAATEYLRKFPGGRHRDEIEWQLLQLQHEVYEYEGFAETPRSQLIAYESFLSQHDISSVRNRVMLEMAYLCRVIYECLQADLEKNLPDGFVASDIQKYRSKAIDIYRRLASSSDPQLQRLAIVAIYNIEHNRTVYTGRRRDW